MKVGTSAVRTVAAVLSFTGLAWLAGCSDDSPSARLTIGSTTSLYDTGMLEALVSRYEAENPATDVRILAVGTGQALALGRRGDADLLLVHAPEAELEFMRQGFGHDRRTFMRNDFVIAGPPADPAGLRALREEEAGPAALAAIAAARVSFLSRGDDSGTHMRERDLWAALGLQPAGKWYSESGQGMAETLMVASERGAYVLTDRSTFTSLEDVLDLEILAGGGEQLANFYSVMQATRGANPAGAKRFSDWLLSDAVREWIAGYGTERFGHPLFTLVPIEAGPTAIVSRPENALNPFAQAWSLLTSGDLYVLDVVLRSLWISGTALVLATLIGLPLGIGLALSRFRWRTPMVAVVNTGLAFPPVVVGLAVYLLLSRRGALGPLELLYTPIAVIIAQVVLAGPYIAAVSLAALEGVPPDVRLQARGLGASKWQALVLHLREARASLVAAVAAGFGAVISEVGAVMIVGGNLLGETRVMTTAIVLETRRGNFGIAVALGVILLAIAFAVNLSLTLLHSRSLRRPMIS